MMELDEYILTKLLGKGTFGEVYLTQKKTNKSIYYATKKMKRQLVDDPRYNKYFMNEINV